jgi:hypothetical protein
MTTSRRITNKIIVPLRANQSFLLVLIVFLTFRLLLPFVFRNGSYFVEQAPDIGDYLRWGMLADSHLYPFINYWSEYPPLFAWSLIALYRLSTLLPAPIDQRLWFSIVMQLAMVTADTGSLLLVYAIGRRTGSKARALRAAALFAASFIMAYAASGWYESVPVFLLLLSLYLALSDRYALSMVFAGVGFVTKIVPLVVVPAAIKRVSQLRRQVLYVVEFGVVVGVLLAPFAATGFNHLVAFVRVTMNRPTWLSIWALFDGNYQFGATLPISDRFSSANVGQAGSSVLPWPIIHLAFLVFFLFLFTRRLDWRAPRITVAFAGISVNLLLLWSKGFSGQFVAYAVPFIVLLLPNVRGVLYLALLSVVWVAEWPLAFQMLDGQEWFIAWLIIIRTIVLVVLTLEFAAYLFSNLTRYAALATRYTLLICWLTVPIVGLAAINSYTQTRLAADPALPAVELIRDQNKAHAPIVFAGTKIYRRLYAAAQPLSEVLLLPGSKHVPEEVRAQWLIDQLALGPFWLIADEGDPETRDENRQAAEWVSQRACPIDSTAAGAGRVTRFGSAPTGEEQPAKASFGNQITLDSYRLSQSPLSPGAALCAELTWSAPATPDGDYTVFVHLVAPDGRVVAQNDMQPQNGFAPTSQWAAGTPLIDRHGLLLPADLPPGDYTVRVGLYRVDDQTPLRVTRGDNLMPDALGVNLASVRVAP